MNELVNTFLFTGDTIMSEMPLRQSGFTYSAFAPFSENKEKNQNFMLTRNTNNIKED